jgi:hypothetical protein
MSQNNDEDDKKNDEFIIVRYKKHITYKYCDLCKKNISSACFYKHVQNRSHLRRVHAKQMENENIDNILVFET